MKDNLKRNKFIYDLAPKPDGSQSVYAGLFFVTNVMSCHLAEATLLFR